MSGRVRKRGLRSIRLRSSYRTESKYQGETTIQELHNTLQTYVDLHV